MLVMKMEWSNEVTLEFLSLYEQESVIWDPGNPLHKNRTVVYKAWQRIEHSLSIKCPVKDLKKKKESLMATFRPLLNKVKASIKSGNPADVYRPNWFAYEPMARFLERIYQSKSGTDDAEMEDVTREDFTEQSEEEQDEKQIQEDNRRNDDYTDELSSRSDNPESSYEFVSTGRSRKRRGIKLETIQNYSEDPMNNAMRNVCESTDVRDECSVYGELLAIKLRTFDEHDRDILMHDIDNLIFCTKLRKRNQHTTSLYSNHPYGCPHSNSPITTTTNNNARCVPIVNN